MNFDFKFGEMTVYEREKLYNYVLNANPIIILDCGSGKGASTHIMINALKECGKIYSCDPFRSPDFTSEKLHFYQIESSKLIENIIKDDIKPDFIFFDGPEEPEVALNDFIKLNEFVNVGSIFSMHDWCTTIRKYDNGFSKKAELLKPYINSLNTWELIEEIFVDDHKEGEESVGLCFYKKIA